MSVLAHRVGRREDEVQAELVRRDDAVDDALALVVEAAADVESEVGGVRWHLMRTLLHLGELQEEV
jgi:hypothetical protein